MLKKLILENWKSFRYAELPIDPLTVLIGTNASGKSNAIEALEFLNRIAEGKSLRSSLIGEQDYSSIRGDVEWASLKPNNKFTLKALIEGQKEDTDYLYSITVQTLPKVELLAECLIEIHYADEIKNRYSEAEETSKQIVLFQVTSLGIGSSQVSVKLFHDKRSPDDEYFGELDLSFNSSSFHSQLALISSLPSEAYAEAISAFEVAKSILEILREVYVLNPIPSHMRFYSVLSDVFQKDAANIAGFLAAIEEKDKSYIEAALTSYVSNLPERDIQKVWAEKVGILRSDAMLYCEESWASDEPPMIIDARGMSDGTLRFLAIVTALLTRPEGSQLVIEEVDNGLHPSRAELLLRMLKELGVKRKIDILVTTHNPALLDALGLKMVPFVVVAHRDVQTGESKLTSLDDIKHLPKLLASGSVGDLATQGTLEKVLSHSDEA